MSWTIPKYKITISHYSYAYKNAPTENPSYNLKRTDYGEPSLEINWSRESLFVKMKKLNTFK